MSTRKFAGLILCIAFSLGITQATVRNNDSNAPKAIHEDLDRTGWVITASAFKDNNQDPPKSIDNNPDSRWTTGAVQEGGEWFMLDLQTPQKFDVIELNQGRSQSDYPRSYEVYVSKDGKDWGKAIATGVGTKGEATVVTLSKEIKTRYVKMVQTGKSGNWWTVFEVFLKKTR